MEKTKGYAEINEVVISDKLMNLIKDYQVGNANSSLELSRKIILETIAYLVKESDLSRFDGKIGKQFSGFHYLEKAFDLTYALSCFDDFDKPDEYYESKSM